MPRDDEIDLRALLLPEPEALREPGTSEVRPRREAQRLRRLQKLFARVPLSWVNGEDPRPTPFGACERLLLLLLIRSHWGQREVKLTNAMVDQIGVSRQEKFTCLVRLECQGWVRVKRDGQRTPLVRPVVISG
jgi:hypothetical protein